MTEQYTPLDILAAIVVTAEDNGLPTPVRTELDEISQHATLTFPTKRDASRWWPYMELHNNGGWLFHGWSVELNGPARQTPGRATKADPLPPAQDYPSAVFEAALVKADLCIRPTISGTPCTKGYDHLGHCEPDAVAAIVEYARERAAGGASS